MDGKNSGISCQTVWRDHLKEAEKFGEILRGVSSSFQDRENIIDLISEYANGCKQQVVDSFPSPIIGKDKWVHSLGDPGRVPPVPKEIYQELIQPCPFWPKKTVGQTHILAWMPKTITRLSDQDESSQPLTLTLLDNLVKEGPKGDRKGFMHIWENIKTDLDDMSTKGHWALMTKDLVPESRGQNYKDQGALVEKRGYFIPSVIEASSIIFLHEIFSGEYLFGLDPCSYTRCVEEIQGVPLVVGGFSHNGLDINDKEADGDCVGTAAVRRFLGP